MVTRTDRVSAHGSFILLCAAQPLLHANSSNKNFYMYDEVFTTTTQYREVQTWCDSRQAVRIWDVAQQGAGPRDGQRLAEKTPGYKPLTHSQLNSTDLELHKAGLQGNTLFLFFINFPKSRCKLGCDGE